MPNIFKLVASIIICEGAGIMGAVFTQPSVNLWYYYLKKPAFSPPNSVFFPVWTLLYLLMGITLYRIWTKKNAKNLKNKAYVAFFVQLALNAIWSLIFFGLRSPLSGFFIIIILWVAILETIKRIYPLDKVAAQLLYPYLAWVSFATYLNLSIVLLNS